MKLSEERILYLARESLSRIRDEGLAEIANFPLALRQARELIAQWNDKGMPNEFTLWRSPQSSSQI